MYEQLGIGIIMTPPGLLAMFLIRWAWLKWKNRPASLHWFAFIYEGPCANTGRNATASTYTGYPTKKITKPMIEANKSEAGVTLNSTLTNIIYLGAMTRDRFTESQNMAQDGGE